MRFAVIARSGLACSLAGWTVAAVCQETGMSTGAVYSDLIDGDFVTANASTRVLGGSQTDNFVLKLAGIPDGAEVVKVLANWSYLSSGSNPNGEAAITINNKAVNGTVSGTGSPDLVWGKDYAVAYTADVTNLVTGNGNYTIGSAVDDPVGLGALGEGISLVAVWQKDGAQQKQINIWSGYTSTTSGNGSGQLGFNHGPYQGGPTHFFINALDGQDEFTDDFFINGNKVSGKLGTATDGNAWQGSAGPGLVGTNFYDFAEGDTAPYMGVGDPGIGFQTKGFSNAGGYTDAIGHSFAAMSFAAQPVPEPLSMLLLGGGFALILRRRRP